MMIKVLITFFAVATIYSIIRRDWPMSLYFLGATILNIGVMVK